MSGSQQKPEMTIISREASIIMKEVVRGLFIEMKQWPLLVIFLVLWHNQPLLQRY